MAEQGGFQKLGRQGAAVDRDEHLVRARGVGVDGLGDQLLAGAGFARDQNGGAAGSHLGHQIQDAHHTLAAADDVGEAVALLEGALELGVLALQAMPGDDPFDLQQQLVVLPGLLEVIGGAGLERVHGHLSRSVGGDQEDGQFDVALPDLAEHLHARAVGHHQIEQHQVVVAIQGRPDALAAVDGQVDGIALQAQERLQALADVGFVVYNQNLPFGKNRGGALDLRHALLSSPTGTPNGTASLPRAGFRPRSRHCARARCHR